MHARADGATAFFLFHYLRLLEEQTRARHAGSLCPPQNWTMPDWSPAPLPTVPLRPIDPKTGSACMPQRLRQPEQPEARSGAIARMAETSSGSAR
jgi:hypothetical protein